MKRIITILLFLTNYASIAQNFTIKRVEISGSKVNSYYDLLDSVAERTYTVKVFSAADNFITPLTNGFRRSRT